MPEVTGQSRRAGVAMFSAIFVMIIVGLLAMQFHYMTRQAQSTAFRFQTSELARQLAASAMEEAFMYVHNETENQSGAFFNKLVSRSSEIDASTTSLDNKNSKGTPVPVALTLAQAAAMPIGARLKIEATARIVDFRNTDSKGARYYENEGVGTLELRVTVEPKPEFKKQLQGACTITRHHDYKVITIVSRRDNSTQRNSYANGFILDYALFVRNGQEEFESSGGLSLNPAKQKLSVDQTGLSPSQFGKIYLGNRRSSNVYLNIGSANADFIPEPRKKEKMIEVDDQTVFKLLPKFFDQVKAQAQKVVNDKGASMKGFSMNGHKAYFEYQRLPVTDEALAPKGDLKDTRTLVQVAELKYQNKKEVTELFPGIRLLPEDSLVDILEGDIRQRYFHHGYFYVDMSGCKIWVKAKKSGKTKEETIEITDPALISQFKNRLIPCINSEHIAAITDGSINSATDNSIDLVYLNNNIANTNPDVLCRIDSANRYLKGSNTTLAHPAMFHFRNTGSVDDPTLSSVPFAHINLWARRLVTRKQLEEFNIYRPDQKKLNLRGVIELSEALTLGEGGDIEYEGCGVIIAPGITLQGGLKRKAGTDSVCVLLTRGQAIQVNTESRIEAALVSLGRNDRNGQVIAGKKLDLLGCLAADNLNLARWAEGVDHKIVYDPAFKRNNDLYQVNIARWVTFERMVEQDE